ncbi:MAG: glycerol-3-phosphate responsive antiterminator [Eubacteriales bacterium]|nr:glycerol-3-phosphate responsive antiterminator [Eubacteriales bacterium]
MNRFAQNGLARRGFARQVEDCTIITAVKDETGLEKCLSVESTIVFVLFGDICTIGEIVKKLHNHGKTAIVHIDLINGLSLKEVSVDYLKNEVCADGIISTKPGLIKYAKELGLYTVLRFFVIDSMALSNIYKQCNQVHPDCIEVLPGVMPKVLRKITESERTPVIAGGLITDKDDICQALGAGAVAVSSTNELVWKM